MNVSLFVGCYQKIVGWMLLEMGLMEREDW
jgi:hypothetical protein